MLYCIVQIFLAKCFPMNLFLVSPTFSVSQKNYKFIKKRILKLKEKEYQKNKQHYKKTFKLLNRNYLVTAHVTVTIHK